MKVKQKEEILNNIANLFSFGLIKEKEKEKEVEAKEEEENEDLLLENNFELPDLTIFTK